MIFIRQTERIRGPARCFRAGSALAWLAVIAPAAICRAEKPSERVGPPADLCLLMLRDPAVAAELKLTDEQSEAIDKAVRREADDLLPIWARRASEPQARAVQVRVEGQLRKLVEPAQWERFEQIKLQKRKILGLLDPYAAEKLKLSKETLKFIDECGDTAFEEKYGRSGGSKPKGADPWAEATQRVRARLGDDVAGQWDTLRGAPFDMRKLRERAIPAPELRRAEEWVNGKPQKLEDLRGKVVILVFWRHGCPACSRSYSVFRDWNQTLGDKGAVMIGMHSPSSEPEGNPALVKSKISEAGMTYPIALDNELTNWKGWGVNSWPSVYVIDKRGDVRYAGSASFGGVGEGGEPAVRKIVEKLLAE
jgi:peroxiredoxin